MRPFAHIDEKSVVLIADKVFTLALPPPTFGLVIDWNGSQRTPPEFRFELWANATINLTNMELFGAALHAHSFDDLDVDSVDEQLKSYLDLDMLADNIDTVIEAREGGTDGDNITIAFTADGTGTGQLDESAFPDIVFHFADGVTTVGNFEEAVAAGTKLSVKTAGADGTLAATDDEFVATNLAGGQDTALNFAAPHNLLTGDGPVHLVSDADNPDGLDASDEYWVIVLDADSVALADSLENAMLGIAVEATDQGSGTITLSDLTTTQRAHWHSEGLLGPAGDGAIAVTSRIGYTTWRRHDSRTFAYALRGNLSASDPEWVSSQIFPLFDHA